MKEETTSKVKRMDHITVDKSEIAFILFRDEQERDFLPTIFDLEIIEENGEKFVLFPEAYSRLHLVEVGKKFTFKEAFEYLYGKSECIYREETPEKFYVKSTITIAFKSNTQSYESFHGKITLYGEDRNEGEAYYKYLVDLWNNDKSTLEINNKEGIKMSYPKKESY